MNIILFDIKDFYPNKEIIRLSDYRFDHISKVLKPQVNDTLKVGLLNGDMGIGRVCHLTDQYVDISVSLDRPAPAPLQLAIVLAMPRPKVLRRTLKHIITLGVKDIYLMNAYRVEKSYWQTPHLKEDALRNISINALEQACDTTVPAIHLEPLFKPFVEDRLEDIIKGSFPIVAHPHAAAAGLPRTGQHITLAIGPEGGFIPYELDKLKTCGFTEMNFGERILTVETAVPALISSLSGL